MNTKTLMMAVSASLLLVSAPAWAVQGQGQLQGQAGLNAQHQGQGQGQGQGQAQGQAAIAAQQQGQATNASSSNTNLNTIIFPNQPMGNATARSRAFSLNIMGGAVAGNDLAQVNAPAGVAFGRYNGVGVSATSITGPATVAGGSSGVTAIVANSGNQNLFQQNANVTFSNAAATQY